MADARNVREMDVDRDLGQVEEIWLRGAKEAHKPLIPESFWDSRRAFFVEEEVPSAPERYVYEERKGEIVGFMTARGDGYIFEVYVREGFQGQGIGTALFETLKGENPQFPWLKGRHRQFRSSAYVHNRVSVAWHIRNEFMVCGLMICPHTGLPKVELVWKEWNDTLEGRP